jgi:hypothetical protein
VEKTIEMMNRGGVKYLSLKDFHFENGLTTRYGIEAIVYELNANWIGSLNKMPSRDDWLRVGENLNTVFFGYVNVLK